MKNNLTISDKEFTNLTIEAYRDGELEKIVPYLKQGYKINHADVAEGMFFIDFDIDKMEKFAAMGFDVNTPDKWTKNPYWFDFFYDLEADIELVKRVLSIKSLDLNAGSEKGFSLLFRTDSLVKSVTPANIIQLIKLLLDSGIKVGTLDKYEKNALHFWGDYPEVLKLLTLQGLDINKHDNKGYTPFSWFCYSCENEETMIKSVDAFVELGANINYEVILPKSEKLGMTPLFFAISNKKLPLVKHLLELGVDKNQVSKNGLTALEVALSTQNREFIELFFNEDKVDYSTTIKSLLVGYNMVSQNWDAVLYWGLQINEDELEKWEVIHQLSYAYRKNGNIDKALEYALRGINKFGLNNMFFDNIIYIYIISGQYQAAIDFWRKNKANFDPKKTASANTIGHMIVAYEQLQMYTEGIKELKEYADQCHGTSEGRSGFSQFNFACLYGLINDIEGVIHYSAVAIENDYHAYDFECDSSFDNVREHEAFELLMEYSNEKIIYLYLKKENQNVIFYTRTNDKFEIIEFGEEKQSNNKVNVESTAVLINSVYQKSKEYIDKGYAVSEFNYAEKWVSVYDNIFNQIAKETITPLGELRLEWDFNFDYNEEEGNSLERPYYAYSDNNFEIDHYDYIQYIPTKRIFKEIMRKVVKLDSFSNLSKKEEVKLIQSEHDCGDEFHFTWKQ
ncbi:ankyrin repeat domain-containing protein [Flavivirga spongiicola]|uniref:Ankyrin repeat domain-containing protein n=1 Tax=Flavivirga spongiicola TaxID=421621 RepID=A0ABU7XXZ7_9FLAO|nr:ankyrin repeat domain-containing protein [Flavivirga sp. MEBiC05379]MDO5980663.1 ankyrin repeat domain-containing protein [Flavivirga sp. MEBiC05379]